MMLVLLLLLSIFLFFLDRCLFGDRKLPPGPNIFQISGKISSLINTPHVALNDLAKIYGPLMSLRLGGQIVVVASSPAVAKEIHKTNNRSFSGRFLPSVYYSIPGTMHASLVMARECNDTWKNLRSIGQNGIFSPKAIESAAGIRTTKVTEMVKFLRANKDGKVVNIEDLVFATFANITTNVFISRNLFDAGGESESDEKVRSFLNEKIIEKVSSFGLTDVFPMLKGVDFWSKRKAMDIYRNINFIWEYIIKERRSLATNDGSINRNSTKDLLDVLNGHGFPVDQIGILFTELLIAGTDSTTITAVWLMAELIKNQEILLQVCKEIANKAFEGDELNESLLFECQYFQACIKETLRLHIPGPFAVPHRATETCKVNNYTIPKDSIVLVNGWAIQMDPNNWEDPTSFKPERFLNSTIDFKRSTNFEYIPFSAGSRMCPGQNVAIKGVQLVVASLVHYFDWSLPNGEDFSKLDLSDRFGTTLKKDKPLYLIPRPRENYIDEGAGIRKTISGEARTLWDLAEYIDTSIQIPELSLPQHVYQFKPEEINFESLVSRENVSVRRLLRSIREFGVLQIKNHGILTEELRFALANSERIFGLTVECCSSYGDHEKIVWRRDDHQVMEEATAAISEQNYQIFRNCADTACLSLMGCWSSPPFARHFNTNFGPMLDLVVGVVLFSTHKTPGTPANPNLVEDGVELL
ncbi:hypothetical protein DH2020_003135 [Rehmannia glutinosa]|uniref:Uncharacterized protein n=1 Tax=Rehmannia glutinosa TaxID=99300 RepID=A0ABR0XKP8_REHGL